MRALRVLPLVAAMLASAASPAAPQSGGPTIGSCAVLPADNIWNARVDALPVHSRSDAYVNSIGRWTGLHPDFGSGTWNGGPIGIPYTTVPGTQPRVPVSFYYASESDPGPYPIPPNAPIEGGPSSSGDRHVLVVDRDDCVLYELYDAWPRPDGGWAAGSGAIFDLGSNALRPAGFTSADAAGLPILPGLVRYDEVASGAIRHAIRFTAPATQRAYVWPARHYASSSTNPDLPPMGQRFRLKASFDISGFSASVRVILTALRVYGMMLADNGSAWFLSGVPDPRWNDDELVTALRRVPGDAFEAVDVSGLMVDPNSGWARETSPPRPLGSPPPSRGTYVQTYIMYPTSGSAPGTPPPPPPVTHTLTVRVSGTGTVTSSPAGIRCAGGICGTSFLAGSTVTLTASGGALPSWGGACSGRAATCAVSMTGSKSVTAALRTRRR